MQRTDRVLVTGAGGFIGHHLVKRLKAEGKWVRGVDIKMPEYEATDADEFKLLDLRRWENCLTACQKIDQVYNLAADMGGIGYITAYLADIAHNNTLINAHMLEASRASGINRFLYSSSACVYAGYKQRDADVTPLKEEDAYPADPEPGYGWRSSMQRNSAGTTGKTTNSRRGSCDSTMFTARWERTTAARKNHLRRFPAKWR